jgi:hypothetical protein
LLYFYHKFPLLSITKAVLFPEMIVLGVIPFYGGAMTVEAGFSRPSELSTRQIAESVNATGMPDNAEAGKKGGKIVRKARLKLESKTGKNGFVIFYVLNFPGHLREP